MIGFTEYPPTDQSHIILSPAFCDLAETSPAQAGEVLGSLLRSSLTLSGDAADGQVSPAELAREVVARNYELLIMPRETRDTLGNAALAAAGNPAYELLREGAQV